MIIELKKELLKYPEKIKKILEFYEFYKISINSSEIRFARDCDSNPTSIRIKLKDNDNLFVQDYGKGTSYDFINFIIKTRNATFKEVITLIKNELKIDFSTFDVCKRQAPFGGYYEKFNKRSKNNVVNQIYGDEILNKYKKVPNLRFLKDNVSIEVQKKFNIMFDVETQRIIIPIYDCYGNIIGIKGRANWEISEDEPKYLYLSPCYKGNTLYGYHQNYKYLYSDTVILGEAEKFVLQAASYGYRNALGTGGNSLTNEQCKLIMALYPKRVICAYDEGLDLDIIKKNLLKLKSYTRMMNIEILYWDYTRSKYIESGSKMSITDKGKGTFEKILEEEIFEYGK